MYDYITIDARNMFGVADSTDPDPNPDLLPAVGTVAFTSSLKAPTTILSTQTILSLGTVIATIDGSGTLRPPVDGQTASGFDADELRLICPNSPDLLDVGWTWTASFRPQQGQTWQAFTISGITGNPGDTVTLTTLLPTSVKPATQQIIVYDVDGFDDNNPVVPAGYRDGVDWILDPTNMTIHTSEAD